MRAWRVSIPCDRGDTTLSSQHLRLRQSNQIAHNRTVQTFNPPGIASVGDQTNPELS